MNNKLYNEEIKERFLSSYDNLDTQRTIRNVFFKTYLIENTLETDIKDMNLNQIGKCIENTIPFSKNVARSTGRFISQYITWAIENGYRESNINPLKGTDDQFYDQYIDKTRKIHYSKDEFLELLDELQNGQDQALLVLIWHGIMGEGFEELRQLTFEDIDWDNNKVYVKQRNYHVSIDEKAIKYLDKAYKQTTYFQFNKKNGEFNEKELIPANFVFKNVRSPRVQEAQPLGINVLYNRLHTIRDLLDLEFLTPNAIKQSGMIHLAANEAQKNNGVIGYDQFAAVGEKYNYSTITSEDGRHVYYNTYLMKDFINEQNIKDIYDLDVEIQKK